ncbi:hypothetical protein VOLCADRAFT_119537 [Volvox carteri f. nagariensis]|uniref:Uncharacterized protein n=1 Tax=Volvox carteri f. nagariensis TaxID=3068 RepID=D8UDZ7_VOLCA|nr:uncharacterized protein VOLCADRAFT_119537 [Volvox carteri f. nagariensis]EFJ42039.1 hypothetical protein VOLCADRAFT_119537 [Volvox carteri f. nagariensis]|eukprot:XP_002956914.1 hypothetical protein VOLCADRAFT_119537 [Volvox carteri f. nagariensis]
MTPCRALPSMGMTAGLRLELTYENELDDEFTGLAGDDGLMTIAGFGSLLSERSARYTFPHLVNFRIGLVPGWRRVFSHTADVFFLRGIARPETSSHRRGVVVSLFEVPYTPANVAAFISREHEFRFVAVQPLELGTGQPLELGTGQPLELGTGQPIGRKAVVCAANTDSDYRALRCPPAEWSRRWSVHGCTSVWRTDVLPCRVYLRHCVLAARSLGEEAEENFLRATFLADRRTTVGEYLALHLDIMDELPPPELAERYSG